MANELMSATGAEEETSFEQFKDMFVLFGRNTGCSVKLRGRVVLIAFLINDGESHWDKQSEEACVASLKEMSTYLMNTSGLGKDDLYIAYAHCQVTVPYSVEKRNSGRFVEDALRQFGYKDVQSYQEHYERKFDRDEACISFVFNKKFRSYAQQSTALELKEEANPCGNEYSVVSFSGEDIADFQRVFMHELFHQFGAIDYYYPEQVKMEAQNYLPGSIMNDGTTIDSLTRYLIGWDDEPDEDGKAFLKAISKIPEAEFKCAARNEWLD